MVARSVIAAGVMVAGVSGGQAALEAIAGRALFQHAWVPAPASRTGTVGLGPHYDARACASCHADAGPGRVAEDAVGSGMTVLLADAHGRPDPVYGEQLQSKATAEARPEARTRVEWTAVKGLRIATLSIDRWGYGPLGRETRAQVLRAPSLHGIGDLAQVPDRAIAAAADRPERDGVRGRVRWIAGPDGVRRLGRWGWKASSAGLADQVAASMQRDLGVATSRRPAASGDQTPSQTRQDGAQGRGPGPRDADPPLKAIVAYLDSLDEPDLKPTAFFSAGRQAFTRAGCAACHTGQLTRDGRHIEPFTDLLLHDMGPGLDDGVGEGGARASEWRTAPLWNLRAELRQGGLLHDGRARSVAEAVAWHGGEATYSRRRFQALARPDQQAVAAFLGGW